MADKPAAIVDAHQHFWDLDRNYLPFKTVYVEAEWDRADPLAETRWISEVASRTGFLSATADHSESDRRKLFHDNVLRFYGLDG